MVRVRSSRCASGTTSLDRNSRSAQQCEGRSVLRSYVMARPSLRFLFGVQERPDKAASPTRKSSLRVIIQCCLARSGWAQLQQMLGQQRLVAPLASSGLCAGRAPTLPLVLHKLFKIGGNRYLSCVRWCRSLCRTQVIGAPIQAASKAHPISGMANDVAIDSHTQPRAVLPHPLQMKQQ